MAVAPCTSDGQAQQAGAQCADDVVELFVAAAFALFLCLLSGEGAGHEEPGGGDRVECASGCGIRLGAGLGQQVACDLQSDELVIGHVLVQGPDHEVSILEGTGPVLVERVAVALGKPHQVQPVPSPAFAVVRTGQQSIDLAGPRRLEVLLGLGQESLLVVGRGWQSDEVEVEPPQQSRRSGPSVGGDTLGRLQRVDEAVDVGADRVTVWDLGRLDVGQGLKRPVRLARLDVDDGRGHGLPVSRVGGSQLDPFLEVGDDRGGQLGLGRHLEPVVLQGRHQQALLRLPRYDRRSRLASLEDPGPSVDLESSLEHLGRGGLGRMALVAVPDQHRADLRFEEIEPLAILGRLVGSE